ncbi:MAG: pseudouridine-5'-phosphate glycosidase [Candidatus Dormibacteria bacterium]
MADSASMLGRESLYLSPEVEEALRSGSPVVALETAIVAHGLPRPLNLTVAREIEAAVRAGGAIPATVGVLSGRPTVGLTDGELTHLATQPDIAKLSGRDLAIAMAQGVDGSTTVAGTLALAAAAGIRVMATGGLGGVHRGARESWDVSADLIAMQREPVLVVAAGVKSVLDIAATLEELETLGVPVLGYRTRQFPGFLISDSGHRLDWSVPDPEAAAAVFRAVLALGTHPGGMLLANPIDPAQQLDPAWHAELLAEALGQLDAQGIHGKAVTPFLLNHLERATRGESVRVNRTLVLGNARLAAQVARALADG